MEQPFAFSKQIAGKRFYYHANAAQLAPARVRHELQFYERVPLQSVSATAVCSHCRLRFADTARCPGVPYPLP